MPMEVPPPIDPFPQAEDCLPVPSEDNGAERVAAFYRNLLQQVCPAFRFRHGAAVGYQKDGHTFVLAFDNDSASVALSPPAEWVANSKLPSFDQNDEHAFARAVIAVRDEMQKTRQQVSDLSLQSEGPSFVPLSDALPPSLTVPVFSCVVPSPGAEDINVLALVKGEERYVFLYDDASRAEALRALGRFADDPGLSFTWYEAAVLSQKIRHESTKISYQKMFPWAPPPVSHLRAP